MIAALAAAAVTSAAAALTLTPGTIQSFEKVTTIPAEWEKVEYQSGVSSEALITGQAFDGKRFLRITNPRPNHARVLIPATIEPNSTYRVSAMIRAQGGTQVPAFLAVDGANDTSAPVAGDGRWHESQLYLRTGSSTTAKVVLSLGWFSNTVAGRGDFDHVKLEKVASVPNGVAVAAATGAAPEVAADEGPATTGPARMTLPLAIVLIVLILGCGAALLRGTRDR